VIQPTNAQQLQEHLDTVLLRARDGPRSPNAKRIVQHGQPLLLFAGEDDPNTTSEVFRISSKLNYNVSRDFLLPALWSKTLSQLS
jgi:hypothetical protein